jgi:NADPH-dependent curcumin reductase CurA
MSAISNRFWQLDKHPEGNDYAAALSLHDVALAEPGANEVVVKNHYLSLDAGTRMWMTPRTDGYQPPLPLGTPMVGLGVGEVHASNDPNFKPGDLVRGFGQWADYSIVTAELSGLMKLDPTIDDLRQHHGVLGFNGWTAYWGIVNTGQAKAGETVLVSAAAGSTGILACQIAKNLGCNVIGIAGGTDKCSFLREQFGIQAIDYKADNIFEKLQDVEGGINVYFDNVGGPILDEVFPNMALYGRIALCGLVNDYLNAPTQPRRFDQILMKRLRVEGFFSPDFADQGAMLTEKLTAMYKDGSLTMPFDETAGIENMLVAYEKLFTGGNIGKTIVKL